MKVIGKDRTSCDVCNPIDEIIARLDALERRASAIVAKVQGIAPDGEGNVTLPTSSSDTDPLHGRVDAFAMSSEVKEAADDAHAYAASIADDVVVINSEIDALNQAVEALQPAEIEAIKSAVQTLQTTVATLESTVATLNDSVAGKVSKSGDTMTGVLLSHTDSVTPIIIKNKNMDVNETGGAESQITFNDKNNVLMGRVGVTNYGFKSIGISSFWNDTWFDLALRKGADGTVYGIVPSWSVGTNDNSDKILTIKMANSLPSLMHTTGNENVSGNKTFLGEINFKGGVEVNAALPFIDFHFNQSENDYSVRLINGADGLFSIDVRNNDFTKQAFMNFDAVNGNINISPTPSGATGNEIASAGWVKNLINQFATANNLNGI